MDNPPREYRLITSVSQIPWYKSPDQAYIVTGEAMAEIAGELQKLYNIRESLAALSRGD